MAHVHKHAFHYVQFTLSHLKHFSQVCWDQLCFSQTSMMTALLPCLLYAYQPDLHKEEKLRRCIFCREMEFHMQQLAECKFLSKWFVIGFASPLWTLPLLSVPCSIWDYKNLKAITRWISINWIYDECEG